MTDDALFIAPPQAPAGMYPATVTAVEPVTVQTAEGPKALIRWSVALDFEDTRPASDTFGQIVTAEPDALSSQLFTPKSKARRWAIALGVPADQDKVSVRDLVGRECMALIIEKDKGVTGLGDILPPAKGIKAK